MWNKRFLVKGDLKPSFIDPTADLIHIRVRRGPDVAFRKAISRTGDDGAGLRSFRYSGEGEKLMHIIANFRVPDEVVDVLLIVGRCQNCGVGCATGR
jgi:hypothetical protein